MTTTTQAPESILDRPVASLDGVGPARAKVLHALGVDTLGELLDYFPRDYQYESAELPIAQLGEGDIQTARGEVTACDYISHRGKPRFEATLSDGPDRLSLVFFNGHYMRRTVHPGITLRVQGKVRFFRGLPQMSNPKWEIVEPAAEVIEQSKFRSIYPATAKLPSEAIARIVEQNLDLALAEVHEWFAPEVTNSRRLMSRRDAYRAIHVPKNYGEAIAARRRLVYDELMQMQIALAMSKRLTDGRLSAPVLRADKLLDGRIRKRFPFEMTAAQQDAVWHILKDVQSGRPMNRLLQGDVGSGKTIVALYAMLVAVANKMQAVILAPTEVLAEQHYLNISNLLAGSQVNVQLVTGRTKRIGNLSLSKKSEASIQRRLFDGDVHLAVGTQALVQSDIEFSNLGLVVVDEQHRLGVRQRATLKGKGLSPHYLVMTATPIPRTLALSYFADFDVTTIDELPPGRQPITTQWMRQKDAGKAYDFIKRQVAEGRQAYVVVPMIEDDGIEAAGNAAAGGKSVKKELDRLGNGPLAGLRLAPLHGQMTTEEKQATMHEFRDRKIDVLIATTVIEVGIDVPNATVIFIDNAERFGLSQLHQLRGRVGRGQHASHCVLLSDAQGPTAEAHLGAMTTTSSGFEIAELDLKLRGPGEFFGTRQHGLPEFKLADITGELDLLVQAKEDATRIVEDDPKLALPAHRHLRDEMRKRFAETLGLAQIG